MEPRTARIVDRCDRLNQECDRLLNSVDYADEMTVRLSASAGEMQAQIQQLSAAQVTVDRQRKILARKVFWTQFYPSAIKDRVVRSTSKLLGRGNPLTAPARSVSREFGQ